MKKLIGISLLGLLVVISPYFIGQQAEDEVRSMYSKISKSTGYDIEISQYQQGWFNSNATIILKIPMPVEYDTGIEYLSFVSEQKIQHGPILFTSNGFGLGIADIEYQVSLPKQLADILPSELQVPKDTLSIASRLAFNGDIESSTHLRAFDLTIDNALFSVKEAHLNSSMTMAGEMAMSGNWQGFTISEDNTEVLSLANLAISSKQKLIRGEIFSQNALSTGEVVIDIEQMSIHDLTSSAKISNRNSQIKLVISELDDLLSIDALLNSKEIDIDDHKYTNFNYQVILSNLDIDTFQQIQKIMIQAQELPEQQQVASLMQIQSLVPLMIAKDPVFKIKQLGLNTDNGAIASAMNFHFDQSIYDPNNPLSLVMAIKAQAQGEAPKAFFEEMGRVDELNEYIAQGVLIEENDNVTFDFNLAQGQALLNGIPVPLG
ncbi:DUF945 family protein [Thalassomonas sp. M1454]|uniref:DUF945 family protein n=1 Tax=Thalassomonas sp. M1454 TaxID=2594477 RepID=UPI00117D5A98|nr:DUF945 family protein [Thalassomonas sp. M1454]TRX54965.1 DUF945 domain-containing protein [Thalassomonas sp. M1454]